MRKKRSGSVPVVRQVYAREFILRVRCEGAVSGPDEKGLGNSPLRIEMPPGIAHLTEEHIESSDRHLFGRTRQ